ncbi:MAG: protein translocase subunit SecD [Shinella sp.]|nr:protein translocase subunit SecD [Shinella sp.]
MLQSARWKSAALWLVLFASLLVLLPNLLVQKQLERLPAWVSSLRLVPGLDLTGGSHLLLKFERADIENDRLSATVDAVGQRLRAERIPYSGLSGSGRIVEVRISDLGRLSAAQSALSDVADVSVTHQPDGLFRIELSGGALNAAAAQGMAEALDVVRARIDELGMPNAKVLRENADHIVVQVAGLSNPQRLKDLLAQRGRLSARLVDDAVSLQQAIENGAPAGTQLLYSIGEPPIGYVVRRAAIFTGNDIVSAEPVADNQSDEASLDFTLSPDGKTRLADVTRENIGRTIAIVLDDQVLSASIVREPLSIDSLRITGDFDAEGAVNLATVLRSGALPASLTVIEERSIEPALGASSARAAVIAVCVSALAVTVFIASFYGLFGAIAAIGLFFNLVLILAVLSLAGIVMTLPGIAGMVLIIGMAVDSNVLIYERIREEAATGRPLAEAVEGGFLRASSTIVDAGMTMLIAVLVLFFLGSAPLQGFAVTVGIGIVTTGFVAFTLTRWMVKRWMRFTRATHLPRSIRTGIFDGINLRFMSIRNYTFMATAALSIAAALLVSVGGMNLGIDFTGGSMLQVEAKEGRADLVNIADRLEEANLGDVTVRAGRTPAMATIRIPPQGGGENAEQTSALVARGELEADYDFQRVEVVGPSVSGNLISAASLGLVLGLAALIAYIWARFEWQFAIGAIIATAHDIFLTIGFFALTGLEFNIGSIAALLTIAGYSLNDTVVVYDRIRENLKRYRQMPLPILIDASINQTLSRTVLTSATTLIALAALAVFGGEVIRAFALSMFFGIAIGTFSSIYIAGPVLILFKLRPDRYRLGGRKPGSAAEA